MWAAKPPTVEGAKANRVIIYELLKVTNITNTATFAVLINHEAVPQDVLQL